MAIRGVGRTALGVGLMRALEQYEPRKLFDVPPALRPATGWIAPWRRRLRWQIAFSRTVRQDLGAEDHQRDLPRPMGRELDVFEGERLTVSRR
jgi:hypothetical protein